MTSIVTNAIRCSTSTSSNSMGAAVSTTAIAAASASSSSSSNFYTQLPLYVQRLSEHAIIPSRGSEYAAGFDLSAADNVIITANGGRALVPTDLRIACPPGTYIRIAPRSGLAYKHGIDVGAGVIDADYRGPVGVILFNFGTTDFTIQRGDRIAQAILEQICIPSSIIDVPIDEALPNVGNRGANGFGSTGVSSVVTETTNIDEINKKQRIGSDANDENIEKEDTNISSTISNDEEPMNDK